MLRRPWGLSPSFLPLLTLFVCLLVAYVSGVWTVCATPTVVGSAPFKKLPTSHYGTQGERDTITNDTLGTREILVTSSTPSLPADSVSTAADSVAAPTDSISAAQSDSNSGEEPIRLDAPISFAAQDSVVSLGTSRIFLFGQGHVTQKDMRLEAHYMRVNLDSTQVYAEHIYDEKGRPTAYPVFTDGQQRFESSTMQYNYQSQKGYITGVVTQQGEGYLFSEEGKRMPDNTMFIQGGRFTTCPLHRNPHFYLRMTRAKVRPEKDIVTGPVYLVMAGVPLYPIGLPFGFFPFNEKHTSGLIMPSYGEELDRGFYLRGLGLYFAINDYVDLTAKADLYTRGSWGLNLESNYRKRYICSGHISTGYIRTVRGDKDIPKEYSVSQDFHLNWSHTQDPKFDPLRKFSASVNFSTSSYNHNSQNTMYDPDKRAQNTKGSSVSYSRRFQSIPLNITAAMNLDQRSRDSTIAVTLPNLNIALSTIYPFKRKKRIGRERWYEKISLSYTGTLQNSITTKEHLLLKSNLVRDWRNGMQHNIPISASFDLFKYIRITPSISYRARWYTQKTTQRWDDQQRRLVAADTISGFYHVYDISAALSASTTLYGTYRPWRIFGDKIQMIRHRVTPSISMSYTPDFGDPWWGYYERVPYTDEHGEMHEAVYSPFERGIYGVPGRGKAGIISFNFANNLEMKVRSESDTINDGTKKISLIDQFNWGASYNLAADSLRWSNINASIALRFSPRFTLRLSGNFDTYLYDYRLDAQGRPIPYRVNKLRILNGKGLGRLIGTGTSFSYTFDNSTIDKLKAWYAGTVGKWFGKGNDEEEDNSPDEKAQSNRPATTNPPGRFGPQGPGSFSPGGGEEEDMQDADGYVVQTLPWSLSFNYSMSLGYDLKNFNIETKEYPYKLTHNLSFRGSIKPTRNWDVSFDANYNFDLKKITNMTISITRNMHCWALTANVIPLGPYKSYNVTIGVTGEMLKDLKYSQSNLTNKGGSNVNSWY